MKERVGRETKYLEIMAERDSADRDRKNRLEASIGSSWEKLQQLAAKEEAERTARRLKGAAPPAVPPPQVSRAPPPAGAATARPATGPRPGSMAALVARAPSSAGAARPKPPSLPTVTAASFPALH